MGWFEDILEGFFKIIGLIAEGIRRLFMVVADIVTWFGTKILPIVAVVFGSVVLLLAVLSIFAPVLASKIVIFLLTGNGFLQTINVGALNTGPVAIKLSLDGLRIVLATFLEFIHFDTILAIHNIAFVLSEEYRKMLSKLFKKMGEISELVFGWTYGLRVILENTRTIILTSSSAMGYNYDVSQLIWLNKMTDIMVLWNEKSEQYMEDPESFFFDLEEFVDQYAVDLSGGAHALLFNMVRAQTELIAANANNAVKLQSLASQNQRNVNTLTGQNLDLRLNSLNFAFDGFVHNEYAPLQNQQNESITMNREESRRNKQAMSGLNFKLKLPAGQMSGVDDLEEPEKSEQETLLEDFTTRPFQEDNEQLATEQAAANEQRDKEIAQREAAEKEIVPDEPVVKKPVTKVEFKPRPPVDTWFVGEY